MKTVSARELAAAIRSARDGKMPLSPEAAEALVHSNEQARESDLLTQREHEVLKLMVGWLPNASEAMVFLAPVRTMVFGVLIVGFLIFEPHGLAEIWRRVRRFFHLWPFRS